MKTIHSAIPFLMLLVLAPSALCQLHVTDSNHIPFGEACPSLYSAAPATLLKYLNDNQPTRDNRICVAWAIYGIGDNAYLPGIPALIKLLDFPMPPGVLTTWNHLPVPYPAEESLERIGKPSLPALLVAIEAPPASPLAYKNAVSAWMVINRSADPASGGLAALRRAAHAATDPAVQKRLEDIINDQTPRFCGTGNRPWSIRCRQSAQDGIDRE